MPQGLAWPEVTWMIVFWLASGLVLHAYVTYPLLVRFLGNRMFPSPAMRPRKLGGTVLLVAAHNEQAVIAERIQNALRRGPDTLQVVVVSDGSSDRTDEIVADHARRDGRVRLVRVDRRLGKNHALNEALKQLELPPDTVVVFSDANALYDDFAVDRVRDRLAAGAACVVGKLVFTDAETGTARAEGVYWRYENSIKAAEGRVGRLSIGNGAIFAVTRGDIGELPLDVANDFWIPVTLLGNRRPVVYEPTAIAREPAAKESREEFARKIRMASRQMRGVIRVWPGTDFPTRFQLISHKVIRWFGVALFLVAAGAAAALSGYVTYRFALYSLGAAFLVGAIGLAGRLVGVRVPVADLATHAFLVHVAALAGATLALVGKRHSVWEQAMSSRPVKGGAVGAVSFRSGDPRGGT